MKLFITVTRHGTPVTVDTMPSDLVAWEARSGRSVTSWASEPPSYSDVAYLAWRAATRGQHSRTDDDFLPWLDDGVTDLTLGDVDPGTPTRPGP
jgi:hypothetical protein